MKDVELRQMLEAFRSTHTDAKSRAWANRLEGIILRLEAARGRLGRLEAARGRVDRSAPRPSKFPEAVAQATDYML